MKNITITKLSLCSLNPSPLISNNGDALKILNSRFYNHFSTLFYSNSPNIKFKKTNFANFLSTAIKVDNEQLQSTTYSKFKDYSTEKQVKISSCVFYQCNNKDEDISGGAISIKNVQTEAIIKRSGFIYCKSLFYGGAAYISCKKVGITFSCFEENRAIKGGQSFYIKADDFYCYNMIISECGLKLNALQKTTIVYNSEVHIDNSNISSNRFVTNENGISFVNCQKITFKLNHLANNLGNGLISVFSVKKDSMFERCNIINNTEQNDLPMIFVETKSVVFRSFNFVKNVYPVYFQAKTPEKITLVLCRFDCSIINVTNPDEADFKQCHFNVKVMKDNEIEYPLQFRCYALGATDPPIFQSHIKTPQPEIETVSTPLQVVKSLSNATKVPSEPTFEWLPPGMMFREYGLILFASIITPICIVIHCITTKGSRSIRALSEDW